MTCSETRPTPTLALMADQHPYGPQHTFRCPTPVWEEGRARAKGQGKRDGVSQVLREFMEWYTDQPGAKMPRKPSKS